MEQLNEALSEVSAEEESSEEEDSCDDQASLADALNNVAISENPIASSVPEKENEVTVDHVFSVEKAPVATEQSLESRRSLLSPRAN
jgi:hypothetical protein